MVTLLIWQVVPIILLGGVWLYWRYKNKRLLQMAKNIPGPPPLPFLGNALKFMCQPEEMIKVIKVLITEYGDVLKFWLATDLNIVVSNPEDIKLLLTSNKTSVKGPQYRYMADVLGGGILSGSGTSWRKHRKIATPNYGKRAIESYSDIFNNEANLLLKKFRKLSNGQEIDICKPIVRTTSWTVCQTLMGLTQEETMELPHLQYLIDSSPRMYDIVFERMTKWYLQLDPVFWLTKSNKELKYFMKRMDEFSAAIIKQKVKKLASMEENLDILTPEEDSSKNTQLSVIERFILSHELDSKELLRETFTVFTSSQEATAKITSFLLMMMAYHPTCQEKLYAEIIKVLGDNNTQVTDEHLKQMPYLDMAFKEVLRLFPIGGMLQRTISEDISISSCTLPAGSSLVIPIYHIHRDPRFWKNPDSFDPERFNAENCKNRPTYCYIPFSLGPMDCLGSCTLPAGSSLVIPIYHIHRDPRFWKNPDSFDPERFNAENCKNRPTYCYIPFSLGPMDCLGRYFGTKLIKTIVVKVLRVFKLSSPRLYKDLRIAISISATSLDGYHVILIPRH